jgi:hypothetical protein
VTSSQECCHFPFPIQLSNYSTCGAWSCPQPIILCLRQQLACATSHPFGVHFYLFGHPLFYENVRSQGLMARKRLMKSPYPIVTLRVTILSSSMKLSVVHTRPESSWALAELRPFGSAQTISMPCQSFAVKSGPFQCTDASQKCLQSSQSGQGRCTSKGKDDIRETRFDCFILGKSTQRLCTTA